MKTTDFASIVTKIRVWESRLLTKAFYDRLIEAENLDEALKLIEDTPYGNYLEGLNFEKALNASSKNMYEDLYKMTPYKEIVDFMRVKYDYHNIKALIKGKILDKNLSNLLAANGMIDTEILKTAIKDYDLKNLPSLIKEAVKAVLDDYEKTKDPQRIDIILDKYMFRHMKMIVEHIKNEFIEKFVESFIDLTNIKTVLRVKALNKPLKFLKEVLLKGGGLDDSFLEELFLEDISHIPQKLKHTPYESLPYDGIENFEKNMDDYLMKYMKKARFINLGPEPIAVYMYARETEIKNVRIILVGKLNKVSQSLIRERLRESYA